MSTTDRAFRSAMWKKFLEEYVGCHEDGVGNRPCDNGRLCVQCEGLSDIFNSWLEDQVREGRA